MDPISAEIEAEIADHLATAAEQFQSQGLAPDIAEQKSQEQFGDPTTITRRCYWIKQGDALMFRTAVIVLLAILCLALGITTLASYQSQRVMAEQMAALAEQLKAVAENQRTIATTPTAAEPKPLEITGRAILGSPDKPAANINITIIDVKDGGHVRRIATDSNGNFNSGPLGGGDYSLLADIGDPASIGRPGARFPRWVQSEPIVVYPGAPVPVQQFDIARHLSGIAIETSRPLPKATIDDRYTIDTRLMVKVYSSQDRVGTWTTTVEPPLQWPVYPSSNQAARDLNRGGSGLSSRGGREFYDLLNDDDLQHFAETTFADHASRLPAGKIEFAAAVVADVYPVGYKPRPIPQNGPNGSRPKDDADVRRAAMEWQNVTAQMSSGPLSMRRTGAERGGRREFSVDDDRFFWMTKGLGNIWLTHLLDADEENKPPHPHPISIRWLTFGADSVVPLISGQITRLRLTIPDDLESRIRELVDSTADATEFAKATLAEDSSSVAIYRGKPTLQGGTPSTSPFFRMAPITILGNEPMANPHE